MCVSATWLLSADKNSWWANVEKLFPYKLIQLRIQWLLSPSQPNSCFHKLQAMDGQQHADTNEEPPPTYMNIALIELREVRVGAGKALIPPRLDLCWYSVVCHTISFENWNFLVCSKLHKTKFHFQFYLLWQVIQLLLAFCLTVFFRMSISDQQ